MVGLYLSQKRLSLLGRVATGERSWTQRLPPRGATQSTSVLARGLGDPGKAHFSAQKGIGEVHAYVTQLQMCPLSVAWNSPLKREDMFATVTVVQAFSRSQRHGHVALWL